MFTGEREREREREREGENGWRERERREGGRDGGKKRGSEGDRVDKGGMIAIITTSVLDLLKI